MKWLIFLAIVTSCGKHSEPKKTETRDLDGDQQIEQGYFSKYIANFEALDRVTGQIEFTASGNQIVKFSNHVDLQAEAMKLLVGDKKAIRKDDYFLEGSELKIENLLDKNLTLPELTVITINFDEMNSEPSHLLLVKGQAVKNLGPWMRSMLVQLDKRSLTSLLAGDSKLVVKKKPVQEKFFTESTTESIKAKTKKVYVHNGKMTRILYISNELSEEKIHEYLKVRFIKEVTDEELFFNSNMTSEPEWHKRILPNGHQVYFYGTIQQIKKHFMKRFEAKKFNLKRINGMNSNSIELYNSMDSNVFLRVRGVKAENTFATIGHKRNHSGSAPNYISYKCTYQVHQINGTTSIPTTFEDLYGNILDLEDFHKGLKFIEQTDEKGVYWEVMFTPSKLNYKLSLTNRDESTNETVGDISNDCLWLAKPNPTQKVNREAQINFEIESFVERI